MDRKEFIKNSAILGIGMPFLSVLLDACNKNDNLFEAFDVNFKGKVIVVGAGTAGIVAGYLLQRHNIDFEILEASPVYGGRVKRAANFSDFPIDIGAEWIHTDPKILAQLIDNKSVNDNIDIITYNPQTIYSWKDDKLRKQNWASNFYSEYKFKNTTWYGFLEKYFIPLIANKINYNSPVTNIDYSGSSIVLTDSNNKIYSADKVLMTAPIKILQDGDINFTPQLPAQKLDAFSKVTMNDGIKVFIEFTERFYPDVIAEGGLLNNEETDELVYYDAMFGKGSSKNILGIFSIGAPASRFTNLSSDQEIVDKALSELDKMYDGKASQTYVKHIVQNWSKEPYIRGSYSTAINGNAGEIINTIAQEVDNKIYFAGEATTENSQATVHGAGESAYTAVRKMLA